MRTVFADTNFWVARVSRSDQLRDRAIAARRELLSASLITSELVLVEVLNYFSAYRQEIKLAVADSIHEIINDPQIEVVAHSSDSFLNGLVFYRSRSDKGYSMTDCASMSLMYKRGITEVLTHNEHFRQEGFVTLL